MMKLLLNHGLDINSTVDEGNLLFLQKYFEKTTPWRVDRPNSSEIAKYLIEAVRYINARNERGQTTLLYVCSIEAGRQSRDYIHNIVCGILKRSSAVIADYERNTPQSVVKKRDSMELYYTLLEIIGWGVKMSSLRKGRS